MDLILHQTNIHNFSNNQQSTQTSRLREMTGDDTRHPHRICGRSSVFEHKTPSKSVMLSPPHRRLR
ncbi:hypothetical protein Hanom_Chr17g01530531 [Helianthus anomalus]